MDRRLGDRRAVRRDEKALEHRAVKLRLAVQR